MIQIIFSDICCLLVVYNSDVYTKRNIVTVLLLNNTNQMKERNRTEWSGRR